MAAAEIIGQNRLSLVAKMPIYSIANFQIHVTNSSPKNWSPIGRKLVGKYQQSLIEIGQSIIKNWSKDGQENVTQNWSNWPTIDKKNWLKVSG